MDKELVEQKMLREGKVVFANTINYYNHLKVLWEEVMKARKSFNEGYIVGGAKCLEDWVEAQKMLIDFVHPYMEKEALAKIDNNHAEIENITKGQLFVELQASMDPKFWKKIKELLEANERLICYQQALNEMFLIKKPKVNAARLATLE